MTAARRPFWWLGFPVDSHVTRCPVSCRDSYGDSHSKRTDLDKPDHSTATARANTPASQKDLTSIVVTMSVLLASVSETLMSRLVEFIAKVLLEYQIPI